jgi:hypothetical protein
MAVNKFRPKKFEDFEIIDAKDQVVGHIRVKPSGVLWAPRGSHQWYGLSLKEFADYMEQNGTPQSK